MYDPQSLNRYSFERNNPFFYVDENGHVYWDRVIMGAISITASLVSATTGVGLTIAGLPASPTVVGAGVTAAGIAVSSLGFTNFGDAIQDTWAGIIEDDEYFENDMGGFIANIGNVICGKKCGAIGSTIEAYISFREFLGGQPVPGWHWPKTYNWKIFGAIDASLSITGALENAYNVKTMRSVKVITPKKNKHKSSSKPSQELLDKIAEKNRESGRDSPLYWNPQ